MDMSTTASSTVDATSDNMDSWKPYLHTSLFSSFADRTPATGEPFLFPTFRIYSRSTFLAACLFTFCLALVERYLSFLLDTTLTLQKGQPLTQEARARGSGIGKKRKNSLLSSHNTNDGSSSVYVNLPNTTGSIPPQRSRKQSGDGPKLVGRTAVYFAATLLRYVLMIVGMGMDWFLLLSLVAGLTLGHFLTDWHTLRSLHSAADVDEYVARAEEVELLHRIGDDEEEDEDVNGKKEGDYIGAAGSAAHRRSSSRQASISANTPY